MSNGSEKCNEIESEVYDEFLSTELYEHQDHKRICNNNRRGSRRTLLIIFLAALTLSSIILLIYQIPDQLFAKKSSHSSSPSSNGNSTNSKTSDSNHLSSVDPTHCDQADIHLVIKLAILMGEMPLQPVVLLATVRAFVRGGTRDPNPPLVVILAPHQMVVHNPLTLPLV